MKNAPIWTQASLTQQAKVASANFREERIREPLIVWRRTFEEYQGKFGKLLEEYNADQPGQLTPKELANILKAKLGEVLRYMAGPPISNDDLKVLAETSLAPNIVGRDEKAARRVLDVVTQSIDPCRFPWIAQGRKPRANERAAAILASAALITAQRVATTRRNEGKSAQEAKVMAHLERIGFRRVRARNIQTLADAPDKGQFCSECLVGSRKADVPVRMHDGRLMPIECKVSNSSLNSVKRINNDAAVKAKIWREEFGRNQIVPVAVLSGVFNPANLMQAQQGGLTIFWSHRLGDMSRFLRK